MDLMRYVNSDRPGLDCPHTILVSGQRWDFASNGSVMVAVAIDGDSIYQEIEEGIIRNATHRYLSCVLVGTISLAALRKFAGEVQEREKCPDCKGALKCDCRTCSGSGQHYCADCGTDHECMRCNGTGKGECGCDGGLKPRKAIPAYIGDQGVDLCLLREVLQSAPEVERVGLCVANRTIFLHAPGWVAVVAGYDPGKLNLPDDLPRFIDE